jgi:homopolymeric O-antigen transport system permease protein
MTDTSAAARRSPGDVSSSPGAWAKTVRIRPGRGWSASLPDVWEHREVLFFLLLRNLKVRYRQTVLGAAWAVLQPLALMGVFVIFVEKIIKVPSDGVPYPLFAFAALVPWVLVSQSITLAGESVVRDLNLVSKAYVPRLIIPLAAVGALVVEFLIALALLFLIMGGYSTAPKPIAILFVPLFSVLALAIAIAVGVWLAALTVMYRDVRSIVPVLTQIWFFATPIVYPTSLVPEEWRTVYGLNPMVGVVDGFRWALLDTPPPTTGTLAASVAVTLLLLWAGLTYFRRVDRVFADVI